MSYDIRMQKMPVLISYPRSGSNWFNSVMELYFNRPRLRISPSSFLSDIKRRKDFMWFHDHDIFSDLKLSHNNVAYLYRNPSDVIYSLIIAEKKQINKNTIDRQIYLLYKHYKKYIFNSKAIIRYENLKGDEYLNEFSKFIKFFGVSDIDFNLLKKCIKIVKKEDLINKNKNNVYFTKYLISEEYKNNKNKFKEQFGEYINSSLLKKELVNFFT